MISFEPLDTMTAQFLAGEKSGAAFELFAKLSQSYREGHSYIEVEESSLIPSHPYLVLDDNRLYMKRSYDCEALIAQELHRLLQQPTEKLFEIEPAALSEEQYSAAEKAAMHPLFCLLGGPGTGKTYTAGKILSSFLKQKSLPQHLSIALVGPTGKASSNLYKSIEKALGTAPEYIIAQTMHALLGRNEKGPMLPFHYIIVDESSMIDSMMMAQFLSRIAPGTRVLFLGDPYQLPAVEAGEVLSELLSVVPHALLQTCKRTDIAEIVTLARLVNEGDAEQAYRFLTAGQSAVSLHPIDTPKAASEYRFLSPKRSGMHGVVQCNEELGKEAKADLPIIITKNDYELSLMNGQMGMIKGNMAYFEERAIPLILLKEYEPAFCLSVHKSQGSEFDKVVLLLPEGEASSRFGRRMLYTAITRAKKEIQIWGSKETLMATIANSGIRRSSLGDMYKKQSG